ncbi:MAG: 50S ribosomal protein L17 [Candidatus Omnitrophica bacterium]|nr:50S ribosomal protein L17 [Candidatus Omnitrophota bacterium]
MRHARGGRRLSRGSEQRAALLANMAKNLLRHGRIRTTVAKAKETSRVADRLITWGKEGSVHARRAAFDLLQDRSLVKQLFAEIAPRCATVQGGYTRVIRLAPRAGDGAPQALLELTQRPVETPAIRKASEPPHAQPSAPPVKKPQKKFFEGIRGLFRKTKGESIS